MSASAPVAAVQSGLTDISGTVADVVGEAWQTGTGLARGVAGATSDRASGAGQLVTMAAERAVDLADDLLQSAAGVLGRDTRRRRRAGWFSGVLVLLGAAAAVAIGYGVVRRLRSRGAASTTSSTSAVSSPNGTRASQAAVPAEA